MKSLPSIAVALLAVVPLQAQTPVDCTTQLLGSTNDQELFAVDFTTGAASLIGPLPSPSLATEVEYDVRASTLWAAERIFGSIGLYRIDPTSGASLGTLMTAWPLTGLEFVGSTLYGTLGSPSDLVTVDTTTGTVTTIGATGVAAVSGLAYDAGTGVMYGVTAGGGASDLVRIDLTSGAATLVGATGYDHVGSIELAPDGNLYGGITNSGGVNPEYLVRIDTATGAATPVGPTGFSITGLTNCRAPSVTEVPALSGRGLAVLGLTLLGLGLLGIRRRLSS